MTDNKAWQSEARCRSELPGFMHPDRALPSEVADALDVCAACPVLEQCRDEAESQLSSEGRNEAYGIWAGTWWGEQPVWEVERVCSHEPCGETFRTEAAGNRSASFCSSRCRVASYRATRNNLSA